MKRYLKMQKSAAALVILFLILVLSLPAYAATQKEKITSVKLTVAYDSKPEAGEDIGSVTVTLADERIEISDPATYYDPEDTVWIRGEIPVIQLELSVKDTDKYRFTTSTKVTTSGSGSQLKSKKVQDSGDSLLVQIKLKKVTGPLEEIDDYYWEGTDAEWSEIPDADRYEVRLYRGSILVTTVTTSNNHYNFYPYMTKAGDYMFRVRGLCDSDSTKGTWTDKSEECSIAENYVYTGSVPGPTGSGPSAGSSAQTGWVQDQAGWTYRTAGGGLARSTWLYVDNNWFYLGDNYYMKTGFIYVDNNWFYLNPISDGTKGAMKTGWQNISGAWYYFNPISDGTRGAMRTGYQNVDGRQYYLDPNSGILWVNRNVPNGRWADASGAIQ